MQTIHDEGEPATMPHDLSQPRVQSLGSDEGSLTLNELTVLCTTLSKKVEDLQNDLKQTKLTYSSAYTKLILRVKKLEHKGRIIAEIDQNPSISLVQDEGTSWIQEDAKTQGRTNANTEILLDQEKPTELVEDPGSGERVKKKLVLPRVGNHTEVYQVFEDMLKRFDKDDLEKLWDLVKKKFSSTELTIDKEKRYMHDPLKWKLYDTCGVHHVSTERGHDIFMLVEKDYPLTRALMTVMLANKLQVDKSSEMANELLRKILYQVNHKFRGGLLGIKFFYEVYTASST
ncbi:hypothetical protein Tco_1009940 [Tanacetum coccineum]